MFLKLFFLTFLIASYDATPPIPKIPDGYSLCATNTTKPKIEVDIFYDLLCSDSKANDPIFKSVIDQHCGNVKFTYHLFPLPYHHNAYFVAQAAIAIADYDMNKFWLFKDIIFENQDSLLNDATENTPPAEVKNAIVALSKKIGVPCSVVEEGLKNREYDLALRTSWKYACSRYITGTPVFLINGIQVDDAANWGLQKWTSFLQSLL